MEQGTSKILQNVWEHLELSQLLQGHITDQTDSDFRAFNAIALPIGP